MQGKWVRALLCSRALRLPENVHSTVCGPCNLALRIDNLQTPKEGQVFFRRTLPVADRGSDGNSAAGAPPAGRGNRAHGMLSDGGRRIINQGIGREQP